MSTFAQGGPPLVVVEKMILTSNSFNFVLNNVTTDVSRINLRMPTKVVMELVE